MPCSVSLMLTLTKIIDVFEKLTPRNRVEFEKHPSHVMLLGHAFHAKPVFFFNVISGDFRFA